MIPIFIISLKRSPERRASISVQMKKHKLNFTFFDAIDGNSLSKRDLDKVDFELAHELCGHDLSLGEVGCALSHIYLYEKIIKEKIQKCVILEDDIYLHSSFKEIISALSDKDNSEITFLYHGKAKKHLFSKKLPHGYRLEKYRRPSRKSKRGIISTVGYIITIDGARKLLEKSYPVRMPADYLTGRLQLNKLKASGVEPCCLDTGLFDTTINDRNYGAHVK